MADVPPGTKRVLWHGCLHEVGGHEGAWPEEFVKDVIGPFVSRLRERPGKDIWLMGGGEIIASFLDAQAIDQFVISVVPVFIGDGIPLIARRHRHVPLDLHAIDRFEDGVVQLHYRVQKQPSTAREPF